ncbi:Pimeloyl-ACP methyl ester carboxylesterase [Chitinophaga costaii]|uniref:Pimeloyl-ACP methyl ester carboxylesterase n=1 Tax=Chitinophaga costaii TaxID=1335309 RepID=A0A1C4FVN2_9BACT|nr:alpha/beta hydrolase [Chitinophaga costaii]PUZ27264.1 alpha/beta hydrolase [Chitinophaga costaii]SCC60069.1 Pimeloyl-ACP methyl ester carboxylesterase [Chitinophaga costaii]
MPQHIYLISGMGADGRLFQKLRFPENYVVHHLPWLTPVSPDESIAAYAARFVEQIAYPNPVLMGVSFGGILSMEIAKQIPVKKVVLVSSIKSSAEKPAYFNWVRRLGLLHLPDQLILQSRYPVVKFYNNIETQEDEQLLKSFLSRQDNVYLRWAIRTIIHWQSNTIPAPLYHIHGTKDRPFPFRNVKPTHVIQGGGHFMVLNRHQQMNAILQVLLD